MSKNGPEDVDDTLAKLLSALRGLNVTMFASAITAASNRPHSIAEVMELRWDIENALHPRPKNPNFVEWAKTKEERLGRVRE